MSCTLFVFMGFLVSAFSYFVWDEIYRFNFCGYIIGYLPTILEYFAIYSRMFGYLLLNTFAAEFSVPLLPDLKNLLLARFWVLCLHVSFLRQYYLT